MGMLEIKYRISWFNISKRKAKIFMKLDEPKIMAEISHPEGLYDTAYILVKQINSSIARLEERKNFIRFHCNEVSKKISMEYGVDRIVSTKSSLPKIMLKISKPLVELLGFEWKKIPEFKDMLARPDSGKPFHNYSGNRNPRSQFIEMSPIQDTYTDNRVCNLQRGFYSLFVYCDIVEDMVVGDVKSPLLRIVNID